VVSASGRTRPVDAKDRASVLSLWRNLVEYHRELDADYPVLPGIDRALGREFDRGFESADCELFVVRSSGSAQIAGFLFAELETRTAGEVLCSIHELWVEPESRGSGLGSELVAAAEAFFARRGDGRISVRVESGNRLGLEFWRRAGYGERARILEKISRS